MTTKKPYDAAIKLKPFIGKRVRIEANGVAWNTTVTIVGKLMGVGLRVDQKRPYEAIIFDDKNLPFTINPTNIIEISEWSRSADEGGHLRQTGKDTGDDRGLMWLGDR